MGKAEEPTAGQKIPFKVKMKAWWEGYDAADIWSGAPEAPDGAAPKAAPKAPAKPKPKPAEDKAAADAADPDLPVDPWDRNRIDVAQYIWGEGYCGPGGPEHIIAMSKMLALSPELSMADIGAGLGGPARTLAEQFGVWMTGYEQSEALVKAGNELSTMAGMARKAPLVHFNPDGDFAFERRYDRALAKESLYTIEHKENLICKMEEALKPGGLFLIVDYVLEAESVIGTQEYKEWRDGEPHKPYMVTQKELADIITKAGMTIRVNEDQSDHHRDLITKAWKGVDQVASKLMRNPEERHLIDTLLKEAELWNRRVSMMKEGQIKLVRMLAAKREKKTSMMSNW